MIKDFLKRLRTLAHVPTVLKENFYELYNVWVITKMIAIVLVVSTVLAIADIPFSGTSPMSNIVQQPSVEMTEIYDQSNTIILEPKSFDDDMFISVELQEKFKQRLLQRYGWIYQPLDLLSQTLEKRIGEIRHKTVTESATVLTDDSNIGSAAQTTPKPKRKKKAKKKKYRYEIRNDEEFETFCRCVEAEVTGESPNGVSLETAFECKLHVAQVILNRVESSHFPNTITGVVYQPEAFSPLIDGRFWDVEIVDVTRDACRAALLKSTEDTTYGCEFFSANTHYCEWGYEVFTDSVDHTFFKEAV